MMLCIVCVVVFVDIDFFNLVVIYDVCDEEFMFYGFVNMFVIKLDDFIV